MYKNIVVDTFRHTPGLSILGFVDEAIKEREQKMASGEYKSADELEGKKDFLAHFIESHAGNPDLPPL